MSSLHSPCCKLRNSAFKKKYKDSSCVSKGEPKRPKLAWKMKMKVHLKIQPRTRSLGTNSQLKGGSTGWMGKREMNSTNKWRIQTMSVSTLSFSWRWSYLICSTIWGRRGTNGTIEPVSFPKISDLWRIHLLFRIVSSSILFLASRINSK